MIKDEAETIRELANQLLEEDVSVERRQRIARKIITHARAIKAACMAEPVIAYGANRQIGAVMWCSDPGHEAISYERGTIIPLNYG
jgi:hypothetical protein